MEKFHSTFSRVKLASVCVSSLCVEHPVCVYTRTVPSAETLLPSWFYVLARTRFYHTLAIFFRPPVRRLVLTPRDSLVTAASRYRPLGQEPTRCPALRTQTSEGALYYALCFWYESLETSRQNCVRGYCEISDSWGSFYRWYRMLYATDKVWKFIFTVKGLFHLFLYKNYSSLIIL